jgi:methionyl-tRNA synthetase
VSRVYVTTASPSNGLDLGYSLELVQADVLARHHRLRGDRVRFATSRDAPREALTLSSTDVITLGQLPDTEDIRRGRNETWFRLSRYQDQLRDLITTGELRVEPAASRASVLDVLARGVTDVRVPSSWKAMAGYVTSLGDAHYLRWWSTSDRRIHVVGAEALIAHALHWPALLLSAGRPLPTDVFVRASLTDALEGHHSDALRWWLLRDAPGGSVVGSANRDLAGGVGSLVDRVTVIVHRYRDGQPPVAEPDPDASSLLGACRMAPDLVSDSLVDFDFRGATEAVLRIVDEGDRYLRNTRPWELAGRRLDAVLVALLWACRALANQLTPFVPMLAVRIADQCFALSGSLAPPREVFPKLRSGPDRSSAGWQ